MISGTRVAVALRHIMPMMSQVVGDEKVASAVILAAFVSGYEPSFGIRVLWQWGWKQYKKRKLESEEEGPVVRVEKLSVRSIDGISTYIEARLGEFAIDDVQNLATENPIMLYAWTPFGMAEIVDWIAQAELYQLLNRKRSKRSGKSGFETSFTFALRHWRIPNSSWTNSRKTNGSR